MIEVPSTSELSDFNLKQFTLPPLEKYVDKRGFLYIVYDSVFPENIKIGRTGDLFKRLTQYNADKPYPTAKMLYVSKMFENVNDMERRVLTYMYDNTSPTTLSKEWFELKHKQMIIDIIEKAENEHT